ncbi:hypothetical protein DMN91_012373 [Ooceraea biroi]|uniref:Protein KRI1 homolog n=1 Tax=Ooceraea biroi TaxID=2015173 RepID=A0A026VVY3_OOCBI|nr:protein KRI1 homolog [Ooceraea biroi]EZA47646.1 KRI1-like protein [Ooceraea biroi]RLU15379.1 hypothetical protein DMN91_012373 [Ooceraea biroi]
MTTLFNDDNSDSDGELKINESYANIYNNFREKEELHKLKARYGDDAAALDDKTSDTSSSDDDDDEMIEDPQFEKEFLITLACLKNDDPRLYDEKVKFFSDIGKPGTSKDGKSEEKGKKPKKEKSLFLRDYERKIIMEREGRFSSSEDEDDAEQKARSMTTTYVEEQRQLKDSFKDALKDEDDDENDLLKIKQKTEEEKQEEEESYKEWLKGQEVKIDSQDQEILKPLRDYWNDPNLDANEKFLRDYVLNNKHTDTASHDANLEYNHVIHDSDENLSEDERTIQKQEEFEHKYNFRFEEPDQEFIKRYPRTMENSMRKKDTRRAQKRAEVKQRKEEEKQRKNEELKQLKALKRKEIEEKIEKLKEITGNDDMRFDNVDFDSDFDPNEHDRKMKELFNDEYYAVAADEQKPEFPDIDEELEIEHTWDQYDPSTDKIDVGASYEEPHCEDPDFNMDADYDGSRNLQSELEDTKKKKRRRRSKFAELLAKEKPKFDPKQFPSYRQYFDQYYSLDYEDMIGDMPCRFKYRKVTPNDYGLTVDEILTADDRELNKWCSLKQALQYKPEDVEEKELRAYKQKAKNEALKQKILSSLYTNPEEQEKQEDGADEQATGSKKRRRKKKSKANNRDVQSTATDTVSREKDIDITESGTQNNACDSKNDEKQDKDLEGKDVTDKSGKRKRNNKLKTDDPVSKKIRRNNIEKDNEGMNNTSEKIKTNDAGKRESRINDVKIKTEKDIKIEKDSEELSNAKIKNKKKEISAASKKNKKDSKFSKVPKRVGNRRPDDVDSMMSLNAERLKMYGIKAKKFKNKLKYGNRKL